MFRASRVALLASVAAVSITRAAPAQSQTPIETSVIPADVLRYVQ